MKVHLRDEETIALTIDKTNGKLCDIPAGLYNRYFSLIKSLEEVQSELWKSYTAGEMVSPAPPVRENTTADQIRSEILTELIISPKSEFTAPERSAMAEFLARTPPPEQMQQLASPPPKKRMGRPPKAKPQPVNEPA